MFVSLSITFPSLDPGHDQGRRRGEVEEVPELSEARTFLCCWWMPPLSRFPSTGEERRLCLIWMELAFDFMSAAFIVDTDSCCCGSLNPGV